MFWRDKVLRLNPLAVLAVLRSSEAQVKDPVPDVTARIEKARESYEAWLAARREKKD